MAYPLGVAQLALGTGSLTLQAVDECIKFYKLFTEASHMPETQRFLQVRLQMEQQRFLNFAEEVGFLSADTNLNRSLSTHSPAVQGALLELKTLFEKFQQMNGRYVYLTSHDECDESASPSSLTDLLHNTKIGVEKIKLASSIDHRAAKLSALDSIIENAKRRAAKLRKVVIEPRRLVWAAFDQDEFVDLVRKLSEINTYLITFLDEARARRIEKATEASYLEMLQMRNDVTGLKTIIQALTHVAHQDQVVRWAPITAEAPKLSVTTVSEQASRRRMILMRQLASIKLHRLEINQDGESDSDAIQTNLDSDFNITDSFAPEEIPDSRQITWVNEENIWLESVDYSPALLERNPDGALIHHRVYLLARLLSIALPEDFRSPHCQGYIRMHDKGSQPIFKLVLKAPDEMHSPVTIFSLRDLLAGVPMPSLSRRAELSLTLATSLGRFHDVGWLHKGLRSQNILLFGSNLKTADLSQPYITGFELSRPSEMSELTDKARFEPEADMYRHPLVQGGENAAAYGKSFDLYGLGILFLEIAFWLPIESILSIENVGALTPEKLRSIRATIIDDEPETGPNSLEGDIDHPPSSHLVESRFLQRVAALCGDPYRDIVQLLLRATEIESPVYRGEKAASRHRRLQDVFREGVLERLHKVNEGF
ncbi:unnamed protein product [Clonostachys solani]|uniref:Prion-inhibition and propagation HeLo domain-containing protein n=1 Tax=Clonostachys solani TaxID=160281 RepID=A0A9N9YWR3_9HYPO|nr:unnamed protein product [Clonostachys solani]